MTVRSWLWRLLRPRLLMEVEAYPIGTIGQATPGQELRIEGHASVARKTLTAPLTNQACVAFQSQAWGTRSDGDQVRLFQAQDAVDFLLRDPSGVALVRTGLCRFQLMDANPTPLEGAEARRLEASFGNVRFREGALRIGDSCVVLARVKGFVEDPQNLSQSAGYREAPRLLELDAELVTDDPTAVDLSAEE
jgi:hypothetical protein